MDTLTEKELLLAYRGLMLLAFVIEGEESTLCMSAAEKIKSEFKARKYLKENETE